ncbi:MAG: histone deacetylase [Verrucomicrobia bacterium]|nr:histone deacetylase [Verrucomicrobiota bacterium]
MKIIFDEQCANYRRPGHPERPARVTETVKALRAQTELPLAWAAPGEVTDELILRAHSPQMISRLYVEEDFDADTPYHAGIAAHARRSVGGALTAMQSARAGETAFNLLRPPGHHATRNRSMGFCYLNSVAIAALAALDAGAKRVAVLDFDVHHGNGTEDILKNQHGAAFFSVHQHPAYPDTGARNTGHNCFNFPVPPHTPRAHYREVLESALDHLKKFKPTLIGVSAGFDAYVRDPLAQGTLEMEDFHWLGASLRKMSVPTFSLLEGGYSSKLPELVFAYLKGLEGK